MRHHVPSAPARFVIALLISVLIAGLPARLESVDPKTAQRIDEEIEKVGAEVIKVRRFIHMNPELGNREFETARLISSKLKPLGFEVRTGVAKTGVVAVLRGSLPGPAVAVRADMDALPIQETTDLPYKSLNPGIMHACGHDIHTSVVLGTALVLNALKDRIKGTVTFLFQPAEEGAPDGEEGGADLMIREGALENPAVGAIFGFHVWPENVGTMLVAPGPVTAAADNFTITIEGQSAHGARPHEGVDSIVVAAEIVSALQSIVSRNLDPLDPAVLTIGTIRGGTRPNILAETVVLEGTIRTLNEATRKKMPVLMKNIVRGVAQMHGAGYRFEHKRGVPAVFNNPELAAAMGPTLVKLLGKDKVLEWKPQMVAEDFSFFAQKVPGFYFFLGVKDPAQAVAAPLHSPDFNPDERSIPVGIRVLCHLLLDALDTQAAMGAGSLRK